MLFEMIQTPQNNRIAQANALPHWWQIPNEIYTEQFIMKFSDIEMQFIAHGCVLFFETYNQKCIGMFEIKQLQSTALALHCPLFNLMLRRINFIIYQFVRLNNNADGRDNYNE